MTNGTESPGGLAHRHRAGTPSGGNSQPTAFRTVAGNHHCDLWNRVLGFGLTG
jgi:hypothetical protein